MMRYILLRSRALGHVVSGLCLVVANRLRL